MIKEQCVARWSGLHADTVEVWTSMVKLPLTAETMNAEKSFVCYYIAYSITSDWTGLAQRNLIILLCAEKSNEHRFFSVKQSRILVSQCGPISITRDLRIREQTNCLKFGSCCGLRTWLENYIRGAKDTNCKYYVDKEINKRRKRTWK